MAKLFPVNMWKKVGSTLYPASSSWGVGIPADQPMVTGTVKDVNSFGADVTTDGSLENWEYTINIGAACPWDWTWLGENAGASIIRSDEVYYGTYSAKMTVNETYGAGGVGYSYPILTLYLNASSSSPTLNAGAMIKGDPGNDIVLMYLINNKFEDGFTQAYNFTTSSWVSQSDLETVSKDSDYIKVHTTTDSWANYETGDFSKPMSAEVSLIIQHASDSGISYVNYGYISNANHNGFTAQYWELMNDSASSLPILSEDSDVGDYAIQFRSDGVEMSVIASDEIAGLTPSDSYTFSLRAKSVAGTGILYGLFAYEDELGGHWYFYKSGPSAGTWVESNSSLDDNGGFENWTGANLDDWTIFDTSPGGSTFTKESTNVNHGSFAGKFIFLGDGTGKAIKQTVTGLTPGEEYDCDFSIKGAAGGESEVILFLNGAQNQVWNFNTESWEVWTGSPGANQTHTYGCTTSYVDKDLKVDAPADGGITIIITGNSASAQTWYIDDVYLRYNSGQPAAEAYEAFTPTTSYTTLTSQSPQVTIPASGTIQVFLFQMDADNITLDEVALKKDGTGANVIPNNGFETWVAGGLVTDGSFDTYMTAHNILTSWGTWIGGETSGDLEREETEVTTGTYSGKFTLSGAYGASIWQLESGLTAADTYELSFDAKYETTSSLIQLVALNNSFGDATHYYNFSTDTWTALGSPGALDVTITDTFVNYTEDITVPASGKILFLIAQAKDITDSVVAYVDNIKFRKKITAPLVVLDDVQNASNAAELVAGDIVSRVRTTGGTAGNLVEWTIGSGDDNLLLKTSKTFIDASTQPFRVAAPSNASDAATKTYVDTLGAMVLKKLATVNVDAMTAGQYDFYTVPSGYNLIIPTGFYNTYLTYVGWSPVVRTSGSAGTAPRLNFGYQGTYANWTWGCSTLPFSASKLSYLPVYDHPGYGTNDWIENSNLDDWTGSVPDHFTVHAIGTGTLAKETIVVDSGSSAKITAVANGDGYILCGKIREYTPGIYWNNDYKDRKDAGSSASAKSGRFFLNGPYATATKQWNFSTTSWDIITPGSPSLTGNHVEEYSPVGGSWTERGVQLATMPYTDVTGLIYMCVYGKGNASDLIYIDTLDTSPSDANSHSKAYNMPIVIPAAANLKVTVTEVAGAGGGNNLEYDIDLFGYLVST